METKEDDIKWTSNPEIAEKGVLVASDSISEWMLSWWWDNYHKHNTLPVAFVDLGMSPKSVDFCKQKGIVIPYTYKDIKITNREQVNPELVNYWETIHPPHYLWKSRTAWFRKPFALLLTPFKKTI